MLNVTATLSFSDIPGERHGTRHAWYILQALRSITGGMGHALHMKSNKDRNSKAPRKNIENSVYPSPTLRSMAGKAHRACIL